MNNDMKLYYEYTISPLGQLFYKTVFSQLKYIENKKILDFGNGFAFTSNFLAKNNDVTGIEMDESIIEYSQKTNEFNQIHGDLTAIKDFKDETFDVVVCHLVLEFVDNPKEILKELTRVLKKNGTLSVVRHNRNGRIIQAVVTDYDLKDAKHLLNNGFSHSSAFGDIKYYENDDLFSLLDDKFDIKNIYGVRTLASLHNQEIQNSKNWVQEMFEIEKELMANKDYMKISYFNHILLNKK